MWESWLPDQGSNPSPCIGREMLNHRTTREVRLVPRPLPGLTLESVEILCTRVMQEEQGPHHPPRLSVGMKVQLPHSSGPALGNPIILPSAELSGTRSEAACHDLESGMQKPATLDWNKGCAVSPKLSELRIVRRRHRKHLCSEKTYLKENIASPPHPLLHPLVAHSFLRGIGLLVSSSF